MKLTLEIKVDGGIRLPFSANVETISDLAKFGRTLQDRSRDVGRVIPDVKDAKITGAKLTAE